MKAKSYKDNNIIPKIGDSVVFKNGNYFGEINSTKGSGLDYAPDVIYIVEKVTRQDYNNNYNNEINYICTVKHNDIIECCGYGWLEKVEEEEDDMEIKTKSYKENNLVPKVRDRIVFAEKWFRECAKNAPEKRSKYDTHTIFIVTEVGKEEEGGLTYVCKIEHNDIIEYCNYHWLRKVTEEVEVKEKVREEFTTIEQDMLEVLI